MDELDKLAQFGNAITPNTWHVTTGGNFKFKAGILNIFLWGWEGAGESEEAPEDEWMGRLKGPLRFLPLSWFDQNASGFVGSAEIQLDLTWAGCAVLIHELAHVAVYRYAAFKSRAWKSDHGFTQLMVKDDPHGPLFQKAWWLLITRAVQQYRDQVPRDIIMLAPSVMFEVMPGSKAECEQRVKDTGLRFCDCAEALVLEKLLTTTN